MYEIRETLLKNLGLHDINPLICGYQQCRPGHRFGPAIREYFLLHYVAGGHGVLENSRGSHNAAAGDIFVIRPKERTVYTANETSPWAYYWVGFESSLNLSRLLEKDVIHSPSCHSAFKALVQPHMPAEAEMYATAKVYEILALLCPAPAGQRGAEFVLAAQNYIEASYQKPISVAALAAGLGVNRSYFSKRFKACTGKAPQQYIVDYRMEKALAMMREYGLKPGEAAEEVGYPDVFSFSRMFKRRFGVSPGRYNELQA